MLYPFVVFLILLPEKYELPVNDYVVSIGMLVLILPVITAVQNNLKPALANYDYK